MNIPRNHHYVSQVLSKKFLSTEGQIYVYNKQKDTINMSASTRFLFSQRDLNSLKDSNGIIDHASVESALDKNFETGFNTHYDVIIKTLNQNNYKGTTVSLSDGKTGNLISNYEEVQRSIKYLIGMALIGESRHPEKIKRRNDAIFETLLEISEYATDELKSEIHELCERQLDMTSKIGLDFVELLDGILKNMGDVTYSIQIAPEGEYFFLPDCSAAIKHFRAEDTIIEGAVYYNMAETIGLVSMPINSKIIIQAILKASL